MNSTLVNLSNPNILINGDFQVWQRGVEFVNVENGNYTADRWRLYHVDTYNITISKTEDGLKIVGVSDGMANGYRRPSIYQRFEDDFYYKNAGKPYVLSFCIDGFVTVEKGVIPSDPENIVDIPLYGDVTVNWVKLELGEVATSFVPKLYPEELALCQRYYQLWKLMQSKAYYEDKYFTGTLYPVEMRTTPTYADGRQAFFNANSVNITSDLSCISLDQYGVYSVVFNSNQTIADGYVWLDAEIY